MVSRPVNTIMVYISYTYFNGLIICLYKILWAKCTLMEISRLALYTLVPRSTYPIGPTPVTQRSSTQRIHIQQQYCICIHCRTTTEVISYQLSLLPPVQLTFFNYTELFIWTRQFGIRREFDENWQHNKRQWYGFGGLISCPVKML